MKGISLFSGMGGDSLGMKNAGVKLLAYSEKENVFRNTHDANFPDSTVLGKDVKSDITAISDETFASYKGKVDVIFAGFPCFVEGTHVLTDNGYKKIEDVVLTDRLLTHSGEFRDIVNLQRKMYSSNLYEINVKYHGETITCTEEHPFYARKRLKRWNNKLRKYEYSFDKPEWISADKLTRDHYLGMVINKRCVIPEFSFKRKVNAYKSENINIRLDEPDMWFMMGYFVGDGWVEDTRKKDGRLMHKIRFAINNDDYETVYSKIKNYLPITDKRCDSGEHCKKYGCNNLVWYNIFKMFGKYAHGKMIPEWVQDAPVELIEEFLNGYLTADGCIRKGRLNKITTVSYNLAYATQRLYLKLGKIFSIHKSVVPKKKVIEGRTVNQRDFYIISGYPNLEKNSVGYIEDGYCWYSHNLSIKSTTTIPVYNFEVDIDNSYIVENTIVHNCQGFSQAGKKLPDDPRNTLFREFLRATKLIEPSYIIGENVSGLLTRKTASGEKYIDVIVKSFEDIGYKVKYSVFKCEEYGVPQLRRRLILVGVKDTIPGEYTFPKPTTLTPLGLSDIVEFDMHGAIEIKPDVFDMSTLPPECVLTDMDNDEREKSHGEPGAPHPYLRLKVNMETSKGEKIKPEWKGKQFKSLVSFQKRDSPIHIEIVDIRNPSKTIICTYGHQPRLFVPLRNKHGYFIRMLLPDELKQIQGFPKDYKLTGNVSNQIKQIGNAVPPPLIENIVRPLYLLSPDSVDSLDSKKLQICQIERL